MTDTPIARLWRGEIALHDTFWRHVVLYALLVNIATSVGFMALITSNQAVLALLVGYGCSIPYNLFVLIALWRSAENYDGDSSTAEFMRVAGTFWIGLLSIT